MYSIFYYKDDHERHIVVQDIHALRDIAHMLIQGRFYFKVIQGMYPVACTTIGFQDTGFWLKPEKCYYKMMYAKRTENEDV